MEYIRKKCFHFLVSKFLFWSHQEVNTIISLSNDTFTGSVVSKTDFNWNVDFSLALIRSKFESIVYDVYEKLKKNWISVVLTHIRLLKVAMLRPDNLFTKKKKKFSQKTYILLATGHCFCSNWVTWIIILCYERNYNKK